MRWRNKNKLWIVDGRSETSHGIFRALPLASREMKTLLLPNTEMKALLRVSMRGKRRGVKRKLGAKRAEEERRDSRRS